ncbi:uncharacterized protein LOC125323267 isoform X2 [Corvus hawaiiensis]|uniref:uncharacterized protein LOC125323267 isoform X2 n=1 Tax=Corvus hawaiiensis TaxID=134902 RepID=UPI0020195393|nr:uncharacterized protein LOC125323267 isoform X2 [Corvus hawaiiensis]
MAKEGAAPPPAPAATPPPRRARGRRLTQRGGAAPPGPGGSRTTGRARSGGTTLGHLVRPPCPLSSEGDSTTSLGNLFQFSVTSTVKKFFIFRWNFLCLSFCPLPLVLLLGTTDKRLIHLLDTHPLETWKDLENCFSCSLEEEIALTSSIFAKVCKGTVSITFPK